jgi:U6 snRNA-associated Sm-like protein LSm6
MMDSPTPPPPPNDQAPPPPPPVASSGSPTDFLKGVVGKRVIVRLVSGVDYRGTYGPFISICSSFLIGPDL